MKGCLGVGTLRESDRQTRQTVQGRGAREGAFRGCMCHIAGSGQVLGNR